jgi:hypothetical protein
MNFLPLLGLVGTLYYLSKINSTKLMSIRIASLLDFDGMKYNIVYFVKFCGMSYLLAGTARP